MQDSKVVPAVSALSSLFPESKDHPLKAFFKSHGVTLKMLSGATGFSVSTIHQGLSSYRQINPALESKMNALADQIRKTELGGK